MRRRKAITRNNVMRSRVKMNMSGLAASTGKSGRNLSNQRGFTYNNLMQKDTNIIFEDIPKKPFYKLPNFDKSLKESVNIFQETTLNYFENYPYIKLHEDYDFNNNTSYACINLKQTDFDNGTLRITKPGIYILEENIEFNPNPNDDFMPRIGQILQYPMGSSGAYHLGFFAAITIECDNVLLDLNDKTMKQSNLHNLEQRFYSHIELASAPFIPKQGPGNFGSTVRYPKNVLVTNGTFALSSHHGIHGNKMENIILHDLKFLDFEVAAIALNGTNNSIMDNIDILGTFTKTTVLSTYSSARFIRRFLKNSKNTDTSRALTLNTGTKTIGMIINELETLMAQTKTAVMNNTILPNNVFKNTTGLYDGNVYGIVLNRHGVVIHDFITSLGATSTGNRDVYLRNVKIKNIKSIPVEVVGISCPNPTTGAYGKGQQVGPVGDVFQVSIASHNNGRYNQNVVSNAKLILGKYNIPKQGTTCIMPQIISWAESGITDIRNIVSLLPQYFTSGGDSMAHKMKGNIGLFISSGERIALDNVTINGVHSLGTSVGTDKFLTTIDKAGAESYGMVITGSTNITLDKVNVNDVKSINGNSNGIMIKSSSNCTHNNISINNIVTNDSSSTATLIIQN